MKSSHKTLTSRLESGWSVFESVLGIITVVLLAGLTLLTSVDVVARYWFNSPVNGAFELTQMMLAVLIFTAMPLTTAASEHVDVELFTQMAGKGIEKWFIALGWLITALVMFVLSWRLWVHALRLANDGAVSNSLGIALAPIGYYAAAGCAASGIIALARLARLAGAEKKNAEKIETGAAGDV